MPDTTPVPAKSIKITPTLRSTLRGPIAGEVPAGLPRLPAIEDQAIPPDPFEWLRSLGSNPRDCFNCEVDDTASMIGEDIYPGDVLIVDTAWTDRHNPAEARGHYVCMGNRFGDLMIGVYEPPHLLLKYSDRTERLSADLLDLVGVGVALVKSTTRK